jgi:hypothetical protein
VIGDALMKFKQTVASSICNFGTYNRVSLTTMVSCRIVIPFLLPFLANAWSQEPATRRNFLNCGSATAFVLSTTLVSEKAVAYERRDVGGADSSAMTKAMNEQAYKTNNRLEASGFKLDTREEEQERLSSALSSFSYDGSTQKKKQTGYRTSTSSSKESK